MADYGFWNLAQQDPSHLALVTPDDERLSAGELLARANRLVHGLRALGLGGGDVVTTVLPNGAPMIELYLACAQAGLYLVPINHHLTGPEIAYIVQDSGARVFVGAERFGARAARRPARSDSRPSGASPSATCRDSARTPTSPGASRTRCRPIARPGRS
jgi:long-chain acyl-CoA synthetase